MALPVIATVGTIATGSNNTSLFSNSVNCDVGDLIIASYHIRNNNTGAFTATALTGGWQKLGQQQFNRSTQAIFYKYATATTSGGLQVSFGNTAAVVCWQMRITGADPDNPFNDFAFSGAGTSTHNLPALTTTLPNCLILGYMAFEGADGRPFIVNAPFTEVVSGQSSTSTAAAAGIVIENDQPIAGGTGTPVINSQVSDEGAYCTLAILGYEPPPPRLTDYIRRRSGVWTPKMDNDSTAVYGSDNQGVWERDGKKVTVWGYFHRTSGLNSGTTEVTFSGLPFSIAPKTASGFSMFPGLVAPQKGMQIAQVDYSITSGISAEGDLMIHGFEGTKTFKIGSYNGTNDTVTIPDYFGSYQFRNFSNECRFSMQLTYLTDDP